MKGTVLAIAISIFTLLIAPAFAGNTDTSSGSTGSPANVEIVALQQQLAHCIDNAKNVGFKCNTYVGCSEREHYIASCMKGNDAPVQYASVNHRVAPKTTDTAGTDYNSVLRDAPPAAGNN